MDTPLKIVVLDAGKANPGDLSWAGIKSIGELTVYDYTAQEDIVPRARDAEIIISNKTTLPGDLLRQCTKLRYIGLLATGYNMVDLDATREMGVTVCNAPAYGTMAVAQHTIALLLEITNHVAHHSDSIHAGNWPSRGWCFWDMPLHELDGMTFGVIGFGNIGRQSGRIARAFGMHVLATGSRPADEGRSIGTYTDLDSLLHRSDVVALHCPENPDTREIIRAKNIAKMKNGAILLNTSRGGLVRDADLADALNSGKLSAAGLDVLSREPMPPENPLATAKNCFLTPHIAWVPQETRQRLLGIVESNLRAFLAGKPVNVVG